MSLSYVSSYYNSIEKAIIETHRILKPYGRFVLDVPDIRSPEHQITMIIEECLGRTDKFDMALQEFEDMLGNYFEIEKVGL